MVFAMNIANDLGVSTLLILDDEPRVCGAIRRLPLGKEFRILTCATAAEFRETILTQQVDVALVDQNLGYGDPLGLAVLGWLRERDPDCFRIIFTGAADLAFAVEAINSEVIDAFLPKPWGDEQAVALVLQGVETCLLRRHNRALLDELGQRNADLLTFNANLEQLVEDRTVHLTEAHQRLQQQQKQLVRLETQGVVSHLARGLAHELNNPLAVILGYAQRLQRKSGDEDTRRRLGVILDEVEHCRILVEQIRHLASPLDEVPVPVDPATLILAAAQQRRLENQAVPIIDIPAELPQVVGAPHSLERVFNEIMANACQARATRMKVRGLKDNDRIRLELANDGATPTDDQVANATKPFYTTRVNEGARGLGLAVAAGMLVEMDGHLELAVSPGGGAMVVLHLPMAKPVHHPAEVPAGKDIAKGCILIVDDDPLMAELLTDIIRDLGHPTRTARSLGEAYELLGLGDTIAILSDLNLTDGLGTDLESHLAALHPHLLARLALITGDLRPGIAGDLPILAKPFRIEQVQVLLDKLIP